MKSAIGVLELSSISQGFYVCDTMLKTAMVELLVSRTICAGKYVVIVTGDVAEVTASVKAGEKAADFAYIDSTIIARIHPDVISAIRGIKLPEYLQALGVVESFSVSSLVEAADFAVKTSQVQLIEVRLAMALGGKAFFSLTGTVADVKSAVQRAADYLKEKAALVNKVVIPNPRKEVYFELV